MKKTGRVLAVCLSLKRTDPKKNVGSGLLRVGWGLAGDSHAGTEKEVSLLAEEDVQTLCIETGISMDPGCFAENIRTEGIDIPSLPCGSILQCGKARIKIIQIGKDLALSHTYSYRGYSLLPTKGVFCQVIESGEVKIGDPVTPIGD
ncbi:MAG: MOSC domain-containing protein [Pseudomonadota bacterium]